MLKDPPRQRLRAPERRALILDAFLDETVAVGSIERVAMRAVARRAGCTTPIIYRLFGSRAGLLRETVRWTYRLLLEDVERAGAGDGSALDRVRSIAESFLARPFGRKEVFEAILLVECRSDRSLARHVRGVFRSFAETLTAIFRGGIESGELRLDADPEHAAWRLVDLALFRNQRLLIGLRDPGDYEARELEALLRDMT